MNDRELQNISVRVAGNVFKLEVDKAHEEFYRIAERIFKHKIEYYEKKYADNQRSTIVAMAGYDITVSFLRYIKSIDLSDSIKELEDMLKDS